MRDFLAEKLREKEVMESIKLGRFHIKNIEESDLIRGIF